MVANEEALAFAETKSPGIAMEDADPAIEMVRSAVSRSNSVNAVFDVACNPGFSTAG